MRNLEAGAPVRRPSRNQARWTTAGLALAALVVGLLVSVQTTASADDPPAEVGAITRFTDGVGRFPQGIAAGPDGNMWVAGFGIQRITPTGEVSTFSTYPASSFDPLMITNGADGNLWFTTVGPEIGRITPAGVITMFSVSLPDTSGGADIWAIVGGPDGNLWFTTPHNNVIGRITTTGAVTLFASSRMTGTEALAVGPDGRLWFSYDRGDQATGGIGSISMSGAFSFLDPVALAAQGFGGSMSITTGADGNLWLTDVSAIDRLTPDGVLTRFGIGRQSSAAWGVATGADGNVWFSPINSNQVLRVTPAGVMTWFGAADDPTPHSTWINGIAPGPDGTMWFTNQGSSSSTDHPNATVSRVITGSLPRCAHSPIIDVPTSHPFCGEIEWMLDEGIANGFPDDTFRPNDAVSRQAAAAFLYRLAGSPSGVDPACSAAPFSDVPVDHPFCGEIAWASGEGITNGFPDGSFRPGQDVSREATSAFLYRYAGEPEGADPTCSAAPFKDVAVGHPFCGEIDWTLQSAIVNGYGDGTFRPTSPVDRQAMAAFLYRLDHTIG